MFRRTIAGTITLGLMLACCASLAGAAADRSTTKGTARASVNRSRLVVHGKPFFPVMLIDQCSSEDVARAHRLGINLILNENCDNLSAESQLQLIEGASLAVLPIAMAGASGPGVVGWTYPDEPEGNGWTPARLRGAYPVTRGSADGLLSFVTTGGGFFRSPYRDARIAPDLYRGFAQVADVAGFDLYPLGHCQQDLAAVYDAQRQFVQLAGAMPTFQWIETGPIKPGYCGGFNMSPAELRAEVWLAIAGGARGIGFFTHTWAPEHRAFDVTPSLQHEIEKISALLAAVRPGLTGRATHSTSTSANIKVLARMSGNTTYVFAVNAVASPVKAQLDVPVLRTGAVQAFGERRAVTASGHRFVDSFRPLAVHVYVQRGD
jgi:hypothetical protein